MNSSFKAESWPLEMAKLGVNQRFPLSDSLHEATMAVAAGASSVEAADASSGVRSVAELRARISSGWERIGTCVPGSGWTYDQHLGVWNRAAGGMR